MKNLIKDLEAWVLDKLDYLVVYDIGSRSSPKCLIVRVGEGVSLALRLAIRLANWVGSALADERSYMTLRVVAHLRAQEGKAAELEDVLKGLLEPTRAEPGNISYQLLASLDDDRNFTFVEEYQDGDALDAHFNTPHVEAALARLPELLAEELDMRTYRLVG